MGTVSMRFIIAGLIGAYVKHRWDRVVDYWVAKARVSHVPETFFATWQEVLGVGNNEEVSDRSAQELTAELAFDLYQLTGLTWPKGDQALYALAYIEVIVLLKRWLRNSEAVRGHIDPGPWDHLTLRQIAEVGRRGEESHPIQRRRLAEWQVIAQRYSPTTTLGEYKAMTSRELNAYRNVAGRSIGSLVSLIASSLGPRRGVVSTVRYSLSILFGSAASPAELLQVEHHLEEYFSGRPEYSL